MKRRFWPLIGLMVTVCAFAQQGGLNALHSQPSAQATKQALGVREALGVNFWAWQVNITGDIQGVPFQRQGYLLLTSQLSGDGVASGTNPVEVAFYSGDPWASPETGAVRFVTNGALTQLFGSGQAIAGINFAQVTANFQQDGGTLQVQVDSSTAAASQFFNSFNTSGGVTGGILEVMDGGLNLSFQAGFSTVTGEVLFYGTGYLTYGTVPYHAQLSGQFIKSGTF
jgi:hypothetical protein